MGAQPLVLLRRSFESCQEHQKSLRFGSELVLSCAGRKVIYSADMAYFTLISIILSITSSHVASLQK